jgi:hypothetical protein
MKLASVLGPIALAVMATSTPGHAGGVMPATAGHVWPFGSPNATCLTNPAWDQVANTCNDGVTRLWIIPLQVDVSSNKEIFASMKGGPNGGGSAAACQAMAISFNNGEFSFTARHFNVLTTPKTIDLGIVGVPAHGTVHVECNLGPNGGSVMNVEFQ